MGQGELDVVCDNVFDSLKLIQANRPNAIRKWFRSGKYIAVVDGEIVNDINKMKSKIGEGTKVYFVPVVCGSDPFAIILGIIAIILAVVAIALVFMKPPMDDMDSDSKSYQSDVNVAREGVMLPVLYGKDRVGTVVFSSDRGTGLTQRSIPNRPKVPWLDSKINAYDPGGWSDSVDLIGQLADNSWTSQGRISSGTVTTRMIHAYSDGEVKGIVNGDEGILFDSTALKVGATYNFVSVRTEERVGTDPQAKLNLIDATATPVSVGSDLATTNITRTLSSGLDAVRLSFQTASFYTTKDDKITSTTVALIIEKSISGLGSWSIVSRPIISGEFYEQKVHDITINLDSANQYDIRIRRTNSQTTTDKTQDAVIWDSLVELIRSNVTNDGTALLGLEYTNETFGGSNPEVEVIAEGRIVKVPDNYNAVTRVYTGLWGGGFIDAYTNNPYWISLDIIENKRYGLGDYGISYDATKLYQLAQSADVSVSDGKGGTEPRFTFNGAIKDRKKAVKVLQDILSSARAQYVWDGSQLSFFTEEGVTPTKIATQANVIDGYFAYIGATSEAKNNSVFVTFKDETNQYVKSTVNYRNHDDIRLNGLNEVEFEGVGTTSPAQALRMAKYSVLSDGESVEFSGMEVFADALPGDIVEIYDDKLMGKRSGGRVASATTTTVTIDSPFTVESGRTYELAVILPDGSYEKRSVTNGVGSHSAITVSPAFSLAPQAHADWGIGADNLSPRQFFVQSVSNNNGAYKISGILYDPNKATEVETEIEVEGNVTTSIPQQKYIASPTNVSFSTRVFQSAGNYRRDLLIAWDAPTSTDEILGYDVIYSFFNGAKRTLSVNGVDNTATIENVVSGDYNIEIYAKTLLARSDATLATYTVDTVSPARTVKVTGLELFEQGNNAVFENRDAKFVWNYNSPLQTNVLEGEYGASSTFEDSVFQDFIIEIYDISSGSLLRREANIRISEYAYTLEKNVEDAARIGLTGPSRNFRIEVAYRDVYNKVSDPSKLTVSNPAPPPPNNIIVTGVIGGITVTYEIVDNLLDFAGVLVWASNTPSFTPSDANLISDSNGNKLFFESTTGVTRYFRIAQYDTYGKTGLNISPEFSATPIEVGTVDISDDSITAAKMVAGTITAASGIIDDAAITNANIEGVIQSGTWNDTTKQGWKLDKSGNIQGNSIAIYDAAANPIFSVGGDLNDTVGYGSRSIVNGMLTGFVSDGDVVVFPRAFTSTPIVFFGSGGISASSTLTAPYGQAFVAKSLTASGFTASLKLKELASSPVLVTDASAVVGATQDYEIQKTTATEAYNDIYTFNFVVSVDNLAIGGGNFDPGWVDVGIYINKGSSWEQKIVVRVWADVATTATELVTVSKPITVDGLTNTSTTPRAFGVNKESALVGGSIDSFTNVKYYTATGTPAEESATPSGATSVPYIVLAGLES